MTLKEFIQKLTGNAYNITGQSERVLSWKSWYDGFVKDFHQYKVYNGSSYIRKQMKTLHMAKKVCEDWADLLYNERCLITADNDDANEKLHDALDAVAFDVQVNEGVELGMALGTSAYVLSLDAEKTHITLETVTADKIYPLTIENGLVTECAFVVIKQIDGQTYAYCSLHMKDKVTGFYHIENGLYEYVNDQIGNKPVKAWTWDTGTVHPWFAVFKPNAVNNFDIDSPYGISVFANCEPVLEEIDSQFDAIGNEILLGRMRIIASTESMNYVDTDGSEKPVFDPRDDVFMAMQKGMNESSIIQTIAPTLRTDQQIAALNNSLRHLSAKVGMGANMYAYDSATGGIKTATEVISNNAPLYRRMKKHEKILNECVRALVWAVADIHTKHMNDPIVFDDFTIQFDDSIIQDKDAERKQDEKDVYMGVMSKVEYRMKWFGEDEETATKKVDEAQRYNTSSEGDF